MEPQDLTETVIGSEPIYKGRVVDLRVDTVRLADGREAKREVVAHKGAVCVVALQEDGTVLLVRQFRLPAGKVLLEIPAGGLEPGEEPYDAALRELEEETGYRAATLRSLFACYLAPGYSSELIHTYLATDLTRTQTHFDDNENLELVVLPLEEAVAKVLEGEYDDAKTIAGLLAVHALLRNGGRA